MALFKLAFCASRELAASFSAWLADSSMPGVLARLRSESTAWLFIFTSASPCSTAEVTVPSAPCTAPFTLPTAAVAFEAACEESWEDLSSTPVIFTTNGPSASCVSESKLEASESCWPKFEMSPLASRSLFFASSVLEDKSPEAEERSATALRASVSEAFALSS